MRRLAFVSVLGAAGTAAIERPYYIALGMSSVAMFVALGTAFYVYVKVTKAARQPARTAAVESVAAELDRRSNT